MKTYKQFVESEGMPTQNTTSVPGAGEDNTLHMGPRKKRKYKKTPLTKHYIEINGKRKKRF